MPVTRGEIRKKAEQRVPEEHIRNLPWPILGAVRLTHDDIRRHVGGKKTDFDVMAGLGEAIGWLDKMKGRINVVIESLLRAQEPQRHQPTIDTADTVVAKRKADQMASDESTDRPAKKLKGKEPMPATPQAEGAKVAPSPTPSPTPDSPKPRTPLPASRPSCSGGSSTPSTVNSHKPRTPLPASRPTSSGSAASSSKSTSGASMGPTSTQTDRKSGAQSKNFEASGATTEKGSPSTTMEPRTASSEAQMALNTGVPALSLAQMTQLASQARSALALVSVSTAVSAASAAHSPAPAAPPASTAAPAPAVTANPFIFKTGPLPPHILNAPIPAPPPIPTGPNVAEKTIAAYRKCHEIHFDGTGGRRAPIPCFSCQKSPDKIHNCIINPDVGNRLICNNCAQKKEKCSYQLDDEARIIRETGVDLGPNKCQRCVAEERAQHAAGNLTFTAECYQAPASLRGKRQLGSACSACIFKGKKESCSANRDPRTRGKNHRPRDLIED